MDSNFHPRRRAVVAAGMAAAGLTAIGAPAIAQQRTRIRIGYVDTLAVTGQLWTGVHRGHWAKEGLEFDPVKFNTGLELFNAMIGGSLFFFRETLSYLARRDYVGALVVLIIGVAVISVGKEMARLALVQRD